MFTTVAFQQRRVATALATLDAVTDPTHFTSAEDIRIGKYNKIIGLCCLGHSPQSAYVISPSLRAISRCYISPLIGVSVGYVGRYARLFDDRSRNPMPLITNESLNAYYEKSEDNEDEDDLIGVWLADAPISVASGDIRTIHMASDNSAFAQLIWTYSDVTLTPDLPAGRYAVVGARCWMHQKVGLVRFIFRDEPQRPAVIAINDDTILSSEREFRQGYLGVYGTFDASNPFGIEVLPVKTVATAIYARVDIMKVG